MGAVAAVAISAVAAVAYLAVTGVSIGDLYKSWQQVIQVKEEGLVTVQSLQPVLTPITPIAGKINYGKIAKAAEGGKVAVEDAGTSWGTKEGAAGKIAKAGVKVAKDTAKAGAKIAKGGVVTGAIGGLVLGAAAGNVAQTTSLAAAQTAAEAAKAAAALADAAKTLVQGSEVAKAAQTTAASVAQIAQSNVAGLTSLVAKVGGGGLAGLIVGALGADWVASVAGALGPQGAEILGLLTGAAGGAIVGGAIALTGAALTVAVGAVIAVGALLFAGAVAVITCACCCCRSTVEIGPSKVVAQVATNSGVAKVMVEVDPSAIKDAAKNAKIPVISMKEIVVAGSKKDNTEYDVIENYKPQQVSKIKWLNAPPVGGPTMKLVMAVVCVAVAVTSVVGAAPPVIAIAVVSCAFYASAAGAAYVCRRKAGAIKDAVKAGQLAYAPAEIGEIAPDVEPEQSTSKPPKQEKCQGTTEHR
ncbi:hypothetical protein [Anaplasma ovis]|uniref:hypothetical protein n=1 Tax=Anaplasma ovis TaxID=142058 RepID=UPI0011C14D0C|nr:hypothetical protein [Anaplasma ovis]